MIRDRWVFLLHSATGITSLCVGGSRLFSIFHGPIGILLTMQAILNPTQAFSYSPGELFDRIFMAETPVYSKVKHYLAIT